MGLYPYDNNKKYKYWTLDVGGIYNKFETKNEMQEYHKNFALGTWKWGEL
tara:strand:+ start:409 stop:558 length:150 start_codon:yes stop_codon:yes gene_type:complete